MMLLYKAQLCHRIIIILQDSVMKKTYAIV